MTNPWTVSDLLGELRLAQRYSERLIDSLDPDQVVWRPHPDSSAIAWHLGHQAAVAHFMMRNLTAAEPSHDAALDALFDSATPEPARSALPPLDELMTYRRSIAASVERTIGRIISGDVGAPGQLMIVAAGLLRSVIIHEYQHGTWIAEVRAGLTDEPSPGPESTHLAMVDGYWILR